MLHLYISEVSLVDRSLYESSSSIFTKPAESLKLHIVYENEFKEFGTVSREFLGKGLYRFNQTIPIPIRHPKDINLKHFIHFNLFSTISNNEDLQRLGTGQLGVSATDDILTRTVVFHDDVNQEIIGRASITVFFDKSKITIGENALIQEVTMDPKKKEKEYAFLLSRRLRRTHTPYTPVTSNPILDHKISKDTEWYVQQKLRRPNILLSSKTADTITGTSNRKSSSSTFSQRSTSAPSRRTNHAEPSPPQMSIYHPKVPAALFSSSATRRTTNKTPNRERPAVVPISAGPPKLRKTCMSVGYVHNTWPELDTAEYDKKMYQLQLANERKMELLKAIDEQIKHREEQHKRQQQLANAPPPVKDFVHMTEVEMREHQLKEVKTRQLQQEVLQREAEIKDLQTLFNRLRIETALTSVTIGDHPIYYDPHLPLSMSTSALHVQPHPVLTQSILSTHELHHQHPHSKKDESKRSVIITETSEKKGTKKKKVRNESAKAKVVQLKEEINTNYHRKPFVDTGHHATKAVKKSKMVKKQKTTSSGTDKVEIVFANTYENHDRPAKSMTYLQSPSEKSTNYKQNNFQPMPSLSRTEALLAQQEQETSGRLSLEDILTPQEQHQKALRSKVSHNISKKKTNSTHSQVETLLSSSPLFKRHNLHRDVERVHKLENSVLSSSQKQQLHASILHSESEMKKKTQLDKEKTFSSKKKAKASKDNFQTSSISQRILLPADFPVTTSEKKAKTKMALKRHQQEKELGARRKRSASSSAAIGEKSVIDLPGYLEDLEAEDERLERQFDERKKDSFFKSRSHYLSCSLDSPFVNPRHEVDAVSVSSYDSDDSIDSSKHNQSSPLQSSQESIDNNFFSKQDISSMTQNSSLLNKKDTNKVPEKTFASTNSTNSSSQTQSSRAFDRITKNQQYANYMPASTTASATAASVDSKKLSFNKPSENTVVVKTNTDNQVSDSDDTVDRSTGYRPVSTPPLGQREGRGEIQDSNTSMNINNNNGFKDSSSFAPQPSSSETTAPNEATPQKLRPLPPSLPFTALTSGKDATTPNGKSSKVSDDTLLSPKTLFYKNQLLKRMEDKDSSGGQTPLAGGNSPSMDSFTRANITISTKLSTVAMSRMEKQRSQMETTGLGNEVKEEENIASALPPIEDYDQTVKKMRMLMPVIGKDLQPTIVSQFEKNRRYDNLSNTNTSDTAANNVSLSASSSSIALLTTSSSVAVEIKEPVSITPPPKQSISSTFSAKRERQEFVQQKKRNNMNELRQSVESEISRTSFGTSYGSNRKKLGTKKHSLAASWSTAEDSPHTWSIKKRQHHPPIKSSSDVKGQMDTEWKKIYDAIAAVEKKVKKTSISGVSHVHKKPLLSVDNDQSSSKKGMVSKNKPKENLADEKGKTQISRKSSSLDSDAKHSAPSRIQIDAKPISQGSKDSYSDRDITIEHERKLKMDISDDKHTFMRELDLKADVDEKAISSDGEVEIHDGVDLNQTRVLPSFLPSLSSPPQTNAAKTKPLATPFPTSHINDEEEEDSSMSKNSHESDDADGDENDNDNFENELADHDSWNRGGDYDKSDEDEDEDDRAFAALQQEFNEQLSD